MAPPTRSSYNVCFCDIDGTLVHYPETQAKWGDWETAQGFETTPHYHWPSGCGRGYRTHTQPVADKHMAHSLSITSGRLLQGIISVKTLTELERMRRGGVKLVLITGARLSTMLTRMAFLPAADAYVCENGGRIYYPDATLTVALPIAEDMEWRQTHNATVFDMKTKLAIVQCYEALHREPLIAISYFSSRIEAGPPDSDSIPPLERPGSLWDLYRDLSQQGWALDAISYTTNFRLKAKDGKTAADVAKVVKNLKPELNSSTNIGLADFYPATSGKEKAAQHIVEKFNFRLEEAFLLCDDDNDMGLAAVVGKVFLPSITSDSVRKAVEGNPEKFVVSHKGGIIATEELLEHVEDHIGTFLLG